MSSANNNIDMHDIRHQIHLFKVYDRTLEEAADIALQARGLLHRPTSSPSNSTTKMSTTSPRNAIGSSVPVSPRYLNWYTQQQQQPPHQQSRRLSTSPSSARRRDGNQQQPSTKPAWRFSNILPDKKTSSGGYPISSVGFKKGMTHNHHQHHLSNPSKSKSSCNSNATPSPDIIAPPGSDGVEGDSHTTTHRNLRSKLQRDLEEEILHGITTTPYVPHRPSSLQKENVWPSKPSTPVKDGVTKPSVECISLFRPQTANGVPLRPSPVRYLGGGGSSSPHHHHSPSSNKQHMSSSSAVVSSGYGMGTTRRTVGVIAANGRDEPNHKSTPVKRKPTRVST